MDTHKPRIEACCYLEDAFNPKLLPKYLNQTFKAIEQWGGEFDSIAFRGLSGALLAPALAIGLEKSLIAVRKNESRHSGLKVEGDQAARSYIIVDDFVSTGETVREIERLVYGFAHRSVLLKVFCYLSESDRYIESWHGMDSHLDIHCIGTNR